MGKPLIWYTIDGLRRIGVKDIVVVQGASRNVEEGLKEFNLEDIKYAIQQEPKGMGDAIMSAKDHIAGQFFVLNAGRIDCQEIAAGMLDKSRQTGAKMVLAGQETDKTWLYGIARLDGDKVLEVMEKPAEGKEPSKIKVTGVYLLDNKIFGYIGKVLGSANQNEEFEVAMSHYAKENDARIVILDSDYQSVSLKYPWHLFDAQKYLFDKYLAKKQIAKSARIAKNAVIEGNYQGALLYRRQFRYRQQQRGARQLQFGSGRDGGRALRGGAHDFPARCPYPFGIYRRFNSGSGSAGRRGRDHGQCAAGSGANIRAGEKRKRRRQSLGQSGHRFKGLGNNRGPKLKNRRTRHHSAGPFHRQKLPNWPRRGGGAQP